MADILEVRGVSKLGSHSSALSDGSLKKDYSHSFSYLTALINVLTMQNLAESKDPFTYGKGLQIE